MQQVPHDRFERDYEPITRAPRTFRNVPKAEQDWTCIDDDALNAAFAVLEKVGA